MLSNEWSEEYSVNDDQLDAHHKILFKLLNKLGGLVDINDPKPFLLTIVQELQQYSIFHFNEEESRMKASNFPGYLEHKAEHDTFKHKLESISALINDDVFIAIDQLYFFLNQWIINHMLHTDSKYKNYL